MILVRRSTKKKRPDGLETMLRHYCVLEILKTTIIAEQCPGKSLGGEVVGKEKSHAVYCLADWLVKQLLLSTKSTDTHLIGIYCKYTPLLRHDQGVPMRQRKHCFLFSAFSRFHSVSFQVMH